MAAGSSWWKPRRGRITRRPGGFTSGGSTHTPQPFRAITRRVTISSSTPRISLHGDDLAGAAAKTEHRVAGSPGRAVWARAHGRHRAAATGRGELRIPHFPRNGGFDSRAGRPDLAPVRPDRPGAGGRVWP